MSTGNTNQIIIGIKNEEIFSAAYDVVKHLQKLPQSNFFAQEDGSGRYIQTGDGKIFRYDSSYLGSARFEGGGDEANDERIGFDYDGATWFRSLRNVGSRSAESDWEGLFDAVRKEYHKLYSILEYTPPPRNEAKDRATAEKIAKQIAPLFGRNAEGVGVAKMINTVGSDSGGSTEIYGLSLRIALGTPEPDYVLCRIYFQETSNGQIEPLDYERAEEISNIMTLQNKSVENGGQKNEDAPIAKGEDGGNIRKQALGALTDFIEKEKTNVEESLFAKCIFFVHKEDKQKVENLRAKNAHSNSDIECSSVEVLGISHIRWDSAMYSVSYGDETPLCVIIGLNDTISLQCLNCCDSKLLIENNRILCKMSGGEEHEIVIHPLEENLGLTNEQLAMIESSSPFADHLQNMSNKGHCPLDRRIQSFYNLDNPTGIATCGMRTRCKSQTLTLEVAKGKTEEVCLNCPYPEIVHINHRTGNREATSTLDFFVDKFAMEVSYDESGKRGCRCKVCNRSVTRASMMCQACRNALKIATYGKLDSDEDQKNLKQAQALYRKYSKSLSLIRRLGALFSKKYCFEDDGNILFVLGKKLYILNKLDISDTGYVPSAKRVRL